MANLLVTSASVTIFLFIAQHNSQAITDSIRQPRILTPEEQVLADGARAQVAQVLEKNLIKFFTLVAADNGRELFGRQEDDEEDVTLNPTILPQVAQILSAIFHGGLNISRVIDRTFTLAPVALRGQVEGLFKLLTGSDAKTTTTSAPATTPPKKKIQRKTTTTEEPATIPTTTKRSLKYMLRNRNRTTTENPTVDDFYTDDDELYRLEEEVISAAIDAEPYIKDKQPRFFRGAVREILNNFDAGKLNLTQVVRFLPDLFQGARRAMTLLENLGQLGGGDEEDDY
ncbi:unnamed protein product [Allacma fusca]|uniref:Pseudoflagelliform spidroin n=1 Tax=Allacma fusca TaxID=39272 RepID=A0A8J2KKU5_9HEXA|nr:unnamed protein product [Allacma fusca]